MRRRRRSRVPEERVPEERADEASAPALLTEAIGAEVGRLRVEIRSRDDDLVEALERVADSYDRVADRLESQERVHALIAEALVRIDRRLAAIEGGRLDAGRNGRADLPRGPRVVGGTIIPPVEPPHLAR